MLRDLAHRGEALRGLDQRDDRTISNRGAQCLKLLGGLRLGQHDADRKRLHRRDIVRVPARRGGIDADDGVHRDRRAAQGFARGILVAGRNGILQIDDDAVRAGIGRLVIALRTIGGDEQRRKEGEAREGGRH